MSTRDEMRELLAAALGPESIEGQDDPSRETVERWDSLASLEIVFLLEERLERRLSEEELGRIGSLSQIVAVVDGA